MLRTSDMLRGAWIALAVAAATVWMPSPLARAHGGRFQGPGGRVAPGDPTTPAPAAPKRGPPVVTPGSGIPSTTGSLPDVYWGTWWALNRWAYLPERGEPLRARTAVTGREEGVAPPRDVSRGRRALLARQIVLPYLHEMLAEGPGRQRDTVRAAAVLALAKVSADGQTLERLLRIAEDGRATDLERESAALAVGLLRRTDPALRVDAISLDLARTRLLELIAQEKTPIRARCFAAFALGLLSDQGYGSPFSRDGRLVVKGLLERLAVRPDGVDLPIALLTALAVQPVAAIPSQVHEELQRAVLGAPAFKRTWSPLERAHALTTYVRLRGPGWVTLLQRTLRDRRLPDPVQRAARLAIAGMAPQFTPGERIELAGQLIAAEKTAPDPLSEGVGQIALAHLVNAALRAHAPAILKETAAARVLIERAERSQVAVRGFHALALGLAARDVASADEATVAFLRAARQTLLDGFDRPHGDADLRAAYAVALGLLKHAEARDRLVAVLGERNAGPALRARAAIALAQIGAVDADVRAALRAVIADERPLAPRSTAALALSLLTGIPESTALVRQLREASSQREQFQAALALGQLDDPAALPAIIAVAREHEHNHEMRAVAVAILGLLGDPEERPSFFRLTLGANYIARTDALAEVFSLL